MTREQVLELAKDIYNEAVLKHAIDLLKAMPPLEAAATALRIASFLPDDAEKHFRTCLIAASEKDVPQSKSLRVQTEATPFGPRVLIYENGIAAVNMVLSEKSADTLADTLVRRSGAELPDSHITFVQRSRP